MSTLSTALVLFLVSAAGAAADGMPAVVKVHAGQPDAVLLLNPYTFGGNVNFEHGRVAHWVVLFCVDWYPPCMELRAHYEDIARDYQGRLNVGNGLHSEVRFAEVDCTVNKVLCNTQGVEGYPTVIHYDGKPQTSEWVNTKDLAKAVRKLGKWVNELVVQTPKRLALEQEKAVSRLSNSEQMRVLAGCLAIFCFALNIMRNAGLCPRWALSGEAPNDKPERAEAVVANAANAEAAGDVVRRRTLLPEEWGNERAEILL